jgi:hypothetical protein
VQDAFGIICLFLSSLCRNALDMKRLRQFLQLLPSTREKFVHRRRPLVAGGAVPAPAGLSGQLVALTEDAKRVRGNWLRARIDQGPRSAARSGVQVSRPPRGTATRQTVELPIVQKNSIGD